MNFPANLTLVGMDPFLTEEQAAEIQQALLREQRIIDSLDAEIAQAQAALEKLKQRRSESQKAVSMNSIPSESQMLTIRQSIAEHGSRLEQLEKEILEAVQGREAVESLVAQEKDLRNGSSLSTLEHLNTELEQYHTHIAHLNLERDRVQADIEALQVTVSPIRRLPLEILSEIFVHCLPKKKFIRPSPHEPPLLLTQICRRWRDVAISTSKLWSSILITVTERCHPDISLVQTFMDRSAMHPLSFRINESLADADFTGSLHSEVFGLLWASHVRWKDIQLDYRDWRMPESSLAKIVQTPPSLETLSLHREYWDSEALDPLRRLSHAPHLRKISWSGVLKGYPNPADIMPLESLQKLSLDHTLTKADFMQNLRRSTQLVSCTLSVYLASPIGVDPDAANVRLTFPNLKSFDITTDAADEQIFDVLELPSLETLRISNLIDLGRTESRFWSLSAFKELHLRSRFSLNELDLSGTDIKPGELLQVLRMFTDTLQTLNLSNDHTEHACVDDVVLQELTLVAGRQLLCSNLQYIKLWGCMSSSDGLVSDMLESRWSLERRDHDGRVQLRVVMVMFRDDELHPVDHARLKKLNEKRIGLTVIRRTTALPRNSRDL
ncbi:hypothetical protein GYMLUDRAFT_37736 [Collybiopsis luxurians FD-317 M1]|nr:hypothetical protein GYMLUDRAFT_37736 [Collybiopsis luxurians FD-317 M1]